MNARVKLSAAFGSVNAPLSKPHYLRALVAAALAKNPPALFFSGAPVRDSDLFTDATVLKAALYKLTNYRDAEKPLTLDVGESGFSLRVLLPLSLALGVPTVFTGSPRVFTRNSDELISLLLEKGAVIEKTKDGLTARGKLSAGTYVLSGGVSSQFFTGLMFALSLLKGESNVLYSEKPVSKPYIFMTEETLKDFSVNVKPLENGYSVKGGTFKRTAPYGVPADWAGAAPLLLLGASGRVTAKGLPMTGASPDRAVLDFLKKAGVPFFIRGDSVTVRKPFLKARAVRFDVSDSPDLFPMLAAFSAGLKGKSEFWGVSRLKEKESDRVKATARLLESAGIRSETRGDAFTVYGGKPVGGVYPTANDHRLVMAAAVLAGLAKTPCVIENADCVAKSYPRFFEDVESLKGHVSYE